MDVLATLDDLVRIPSVNASLGGSGEADIGAYLGERLRAIGASVHEIDVPGEAANNIVGVVEGDRPGPTLLLEAHMDTVPWGDGDQQIYNDDGRLYGRGTCDTKASAAAMLCAVERIAGSDQLAGRVIFAGVVDEEATMHGAAALAASFPDLDAAIIGEPTSLQPVRTHNGFARVRLEATGRTAHTSKAHLGVNAVVAAARAIVALEDELSVQLAARNHPLIGPALLTVSMIRGGTAPNIVPGLCEIWLDRRIAPGEREEDVLEEIDAVLAGVRAEGHEVHRDEPWVILPGVETRDNDPIVRAAEVACDRLLGTASPAGGVPYSTDACHLTGRFKIPSVVLGPGSIDQAHADIEWVELSEVTAAVDLYVDVVASFFQDAGDPEATR